jgi:Protein-L-isoaspartate(D-aspartate) O-methyltransferase (PCMT)
MDRREFVVGAAVQAAALAAGPALANVPSPYDWNALPPRGSRDAFVEWMVKNRGENPRFLGERFDRFGELVARHDVWEGAGRQDHCHLRHRSHPPPLLQQLTPAGIMVIPVGPPGAQHVLKAVKRMSPDGQMSVARSDIYGGAIVPFVPFTGSHQS